MEDIQDIANEIFLNMGICHILAIRNGGDTLSCGANENNNRKFVGHINQLRNGTTVSNLYTTKPIYESLDQAKKDMDLIKNELLKKINEY